jgi:hypothetical protein
MTELTSSGGLSGYCYFAVGPFTISVVYFLRRVWVNKKEKGVFFTDLYLVGRRGKFRLVTFLTILMVNLWIFLDTATIIVNFDLAKRANLNTGVVSVIWATTPFFSAMIDWRLNG